MQRSEPFDDNLHHAPYDFWVIIPHLFALQIGVKFFVGLAFIHLLFLFSKSCNPRCASYGGPSFCSITHAKNDALFEGSTEAFVSPLKFEWLGLAMYVVCS